jgi:spermidine/putrescine transport system ATP-binding protein
VTHDQDEALAMSDWVAVMNHGLVVQWGTPWEVYYKPRTPFMADFLGSVNLLWAPIVRRLDGAVEVRLSDATFSVLADAVPPGDRALLAIRPETLSLGVQRVDPACVALAGKVVHRTFLGHLMRYTVRIGEHDWLIDQPDPGSGTLADGQVIVSMNPRRVHVIPEPATT